MYALVGSVAPVHPGSIPSPGIGAASSVAQLALQSRTSIGGGISPVLLAQQVYKHAACKSKGKGKQIAVSSSLASPLQELTCYMGSHSITCHLAEVAFPPLPPAEAGTRFSDPGECKAELTWWLVKH